MANSGDPSAEPGVTATRGWGAGARAAGTALKSEVAPLAARLGTAVERGVTTVGRALEDATTGGGAEVESSESLPALEASAPLASLTARLEREAELWRGVAMRLFTRAAWLDRVAMLGGVGTFIGLLVLSIIAAFRALFADTTGGNGLAVAVLLGIGAVLTAGGSFLLNRIAGRIRHGQIEVAREALSRADLCELRLHRIGVVLELRTVDAESYKAALSQLEAEIRAS